jgi:mono/diheme cytochrome c family protein
MSLRAKLAIFAVTSIVLVGCAAGGSADEAPLVQGRGIYGNSCSVCHGNAGQGGVGPALAEVIATFPSCAEHVEWVTLGSRTWAERYGPTYGATSKPIESVMPAHQGILSEEQIRLVVAFERVTYGNADETLTLSQCDITVDGSP